MQTNRSATPCMYGVIFVCIDYIWSERNDRNYTKKKSMLFTCEQWHELHIPSLNAHSCTYTWIFSRTLAKKFVFNSNFSRLPVETTTCASKRLLNQKFYSQCIFYIDRQFYLLMLCSRQYQYVCVRIHEYVEYIRFT